MFHLALHFVVPAIVAFGFYRPRWRKVLFILFATMIVDLDHLLAQPIYDPSRCSIGFHPLHGAIPITLYGLLLFFPKTRLVGLGLVIHMTLDAFDCVLM